MGESTNSPDIRHRENTLKFLKFWTPEKFTVINLKCEQGGFARVMRPKDAEGLANSVGPDLGLHCLSRPVCQKLRNITVSKYIFCCFYLQETIC